MALNPDDLTPEHLFDVLDSVAVRRTRSFVKHFYSNDRINIDGKPVPIVFPTPRVHKVTYDLDSVLPGFFDRFAHALDVQDDDAAGDDPSVLSLARYAPSRYRQTASTTPTKYSSQGCFDQGFSNDSSPRRTRLPSPANGWPTATMPSSRYSTAAVLRPAMRLRIGWQPTPTRSKKWTSTSTLTSVWSMTRPTSTRTRSPPTYLTTAIC